MGFIATDENKITLYYNSSTSIGRQALAYIKSSEKELLPVDISVTNVPGSHWAELANHLNIDIAELIDKRHPSFVEEYGEEEISFDQHDWLKLLDKSPHVLSYPIAIIGKKFIMVKNPSDLEKYIS